MARGQGEIEIVAVPALSGAITNNGGVNPALRNVGRAGISPPLFYEEISASNAQDSHGSMAEMSEVSTVPPHQMRRPGGASR